MFQSLRANNQIYIFHKGPNPVLETGTVVNVTPPVPKYQIPPVYGQPQEMVVDLVVKVNGQDTNYRQLPANLDIADFGSGGIVLSVSREAMNAEVLSYKNKSIDAINSVDVHKGIIAGCNKILESLNPEFAERQAQQAEMNELRSQMAAMMEMLKGLSSGTVSVAKTKKEQ